MTSLKTKEDAVRSLRELRVALFHYGLDLSAKDKSNALERIVFEASRLVADDFESFVDRHPDAAINPTSWNPASVEEAVTAVRKGALAVAQLSHKAREASEKAGSAAKAEDKVAEELFNEYVDVHEKLSRATQLLSVRKRQLKQLQAGSAAA